MNIAMIDHFKLCFKEDSTKVINITGKLPDNCRYPLKSAEIALEYRFSRSRLLRQAKSYDNFLIESFQLDSEVPFRISYDLNMPRIFFTFILDNDLRFTTGDNLLIAEVSSTNFFLSSEQAGNYDVYCRSGMSAMGVVSVDPLWLSKVLKNYPILSEAVGHMLESSTPFEVLPPCRIDENILNWLFNARIFNHGNEMAQEGFLSSLLIMGLEHYEKLLSSTDAGKINRIRQYINRYFSDPNLNFRNYIDSIGMSLRTTERKFKLIYSQSMKEYLLHLRMLRAQQLITSGMSATETALKVGYLNVNSFRKAYNKFISR